MVLLDIAELSRRSGLPASTLRYYEDRGLIASAGRAGLRRLFDARVEEKLALIALGRAAGFSLDEIAGMFGPGGELQVDRPLLNAKADALDTTIARLTVLRDGLRHAAACRATSHLECATFRRILGAAAAKTRAARQHGTATASPSVPLRNKRRPAS